MKQLKIRRIAFMILAATTSLSASAQLESEKGDTAIVLTDGYMPIDTITISKSSVTFQQIKEAEAVVQGIADPIAKNCAIMNYVMSHPDSDGSAYLFAHVVGVGNGRKIFSALSESVRNGKMKKFCDALDAGIKEMDAMTAKTREACAIGEEAKDFTLEDINGKQLALSSLRGRYVMLDFWGSWCVNCIAAFPELKTFYEQHRDKLEIVGVAFHDTKDKWKAAVQKNELPWLQVIDTEGEGSVAERYGILAVPTYVLIDPDGKIVIWTIGEHVSIEETISACRNIKKV